MGVQKLDKATAVKSILSDLKKGIDKPSILSKIARKCPKTNERTIRRWYDEANEKYNSFMQKALPIIEAQEIEVLGTSARVGILSKLERQKILSDIAQGNVFYIKQVPTKFGIVDVEARPSWSDRKAAIQELNKMDNAYADIDPDGDIEGIEILGLDAHDD